MFSRRFFLKSMGVLASGIALSNGSHARESSSEITLSMPMKVRHMSERGWRLLRMTMFGRGGKFLK